MCVYYVCIYIYIYVYIYIYMHIPRGGVRAKFEPDSDRIWGLGTLPGDVKTWLE